MYSFVYSQPVVTPVMLASRDLAPSQVNAAAAHGRAAASAWKLRAAHLQPQLQVVSISFLQYFNYFID